MTLLHHDGHQPSLLQRLAPRRGVSRESYWYLAQGTPVDHGLESSGLHPRESTDQRVIDALGVASERVAARRAAESSEQRRVRLRRSLGA